LQIFVTFIALLIYYIDFSLKIHQ